MEVVSCSFSVSTNATAARNMQPWLLEPYQARRRGMPSLRSHVLTPR